MKLLCQKIMTMFLITGVITARAATPDTFEGVERAAYRGDYQAQRNLAFGYVSDPYPGQPKNPMLGCAWYLVVLYSGDQQVGEGDVGNVKVYCGRLEPLGRGAAIAQGRTLYQKIYKRAADF